MVVGVIEYLENGKVSVHHEDFKDIHYKVLRNFSSNTEQNGHITHSFSLQRAYHNQSVQYTNYTYDFKGVIDYIFTSRNFMSTLGVLGPVEQDWLDQVRCILNVLLKPSGGKMEHKQQQLGAAGSFQVNFKI